MNDELLLAAFAPTRDYVQDVARVVGKVQQLFVEPDQHDWHRGLVVNELGIATQPLRGVASLIQINLRNGMVETGDSSWPLASTSAQDIFTKLQEWAAAKGSKKSPETPEFQTQSSTFDPAQAAQLLDAMVWSTTQLDELKAKLTTGLTSPVLLYPHHFDVSLSWFPDNDTQQLTFGFSTGDETIAEPYYYTTSYPESEAFTTKVLPTPAYWQKDGFSGAVIKYNELIHDGNPAQKLADYFTTLRS